MFCGPTRWPISTAPMFDDTAMICVVVRSTLPCCLHVLDLVHVGLVDAGHVPERVGRCLAEVEHGRRRHDLGHRARFELVGDHAVGRRHAHLAGRLVAVDAGHGEDVARRGVHHYGLAPAGS